MTPDVPEEAAAARPPDADTLERLGADDWALLVTHVRAALRDLDPEQVTPTTERLRSAPVSRLAAGRVRRELCDLLARGGPVWWDTLGRLRDDPAATELIDRLHRTRAPEGSGGTPSPPSPGPSPREQRLRQRNRDLRRARDDALRRGTGLEARLAAEQERTDELARQVEEAEGAQRQLRDALDEARAERDAAVERVRRRYEAEVAYLKEELREHRRAAQQRRHRRGRPEPGTRAQRTASDGADTPRPRPAPRYAEPGRPSRLPAGVTPGTAEALRALLAPGRRLMVDGYNVTRQHRGHLPLEQQRAWLIKRLETLSLRTGARATAVFDGDPAAAEVPTSARSVAVRFATDRSADDELVAMVDQLAPDAPAVVVTDDRGLTDRLRERRVDVVGTAPLVALVT